jgi:hypothetical protein
MQRMMAPRSILLMAVVLTLSACSHFGPTPAAYMNRGGPEALIDVSSEIVNLSTASKADIVELAAWIENDRPTRAQLNCTGGEGQCTEAQKVLDLNGVPTVSSAGNTSTVTLIYERILARDCNPRYIDNPSNYYNLNHPSFGCAMSANMVQQVTNKQEFVSPNLSDDPSAVRAVNDLRRAYTPRPVVEPYSVGETSIKKTGQ